MHGPQCGAAACQTRPVFRLRGGAAQRPSPAGAPRFGGGGARRTLAELTVPMSAMLRVRRVVPTGHCKKRDGGSSVVGPPRAAIGAGAGRRTCSPESWMPRARRVVAVHDVSALHGGLPLHGGAAWCGASSRKYP